MENIVKKLINAFLNNQELVNVVHGSSDKIQKIYKKSNPVEESYRQEANIFSGAKTWEEQERLEWQVKFESIRFWLEYCTSQDGVFNKYRRKATSEYVNSLGMTFHLGYWRDPGCREYNQSLWDDDDNSVPLKKFKGPWTFAVGIDSCPNFGWMTYTLQFIIQPDGYTKAIYIMEMARVTGTHIDENGEEVADIYIPYMPKK